MRNDRRPLTLDLPLADVHPDSLREDLPIVSVPLIHATSRDFAGVVEHHVDDEGDTTIMYTQYEAWAQLAPRKEIPRPVGFGYTGCSLGDCPPGLECQNTIQGTACRRP